MAYIDIIRPNAADGKLKEVYDGIAKSRGAIAEVHEVASLHPELMQGHLDLYMTLMYGRGGLTRRQRELIATAVSRTNGCEYCIVHHSEAYARYARDDEKVAALAADPETAPLTDEERALVTYALKLTRAPADVEAADADALARRASPTRTCSPRLRSRATSTSSTGLCWAVASTWRPPRHGTTSTDGGAQRGLARAPVFNDLANGFKRRPAGWPAMKSSPMAVGLLLVGALAAGCIGGTGDETLTTSAAGDLPDGASPVPAREAGAVAGAGTALALPTDAPVEATETFTGSFDNTDGCVPVSCPAALAGVGGASHVQVHDITHLVPVGLGTSIEAVATDNVLDGAIGMDHVTISLRYEEEPYEEGAETELSTTVLRYAPGPVELVVHMMFAEPDQTTVDYEVRVTTTIDPTAVYRGVPVGVALDGEGDGLVVDPGADGRPVLFSAWRPDGTSMGLFGTSAGAGVFELGDGEPAGEYVLVVHRPARTPVHVARLNDGGDVPSVRVLPTELVRGEPRTIADDGLTTWSYELPDHVVYTGVRLDMGELSIPEGAVPWVQDFQDGEEPVARVEGPPGVVVEDQGFAPFNCVLCHPVRVYAFTTTPGHHELVPGTYEATIERVYGGGSTTHDVTVVWTR